MNALAIRPRSCASIVAVASAIAAASGCATAAPMPAIAASSEISSDPSYAQPIQQAGQRFGIPEEWIRAVIRAESGGNPRAISSAGAMGAMQLMPGTWDELTARYGLGSDPFDLRANVLAGAGYLRAMLDRYGDLADALAAYNAGPVRVDAWRAGRAALPSETIAYVARVAPAALIPGGMAGTPIAPIAPDWRSAGLFSVHAESSVNASPTAQPASDRDAMPASIGAIPSAIIPSSNGMFVALSGHGS